MRQITDSLLLPICAIALALALLLVPESDAQIGFLIQEADGVPTYKNPRGLVFANSSLNDTRGVINVQPRLPFAADAQVTDTYVITLAPVPAAYSTGMVISFTATTANTGACTINVNGLGAKSLKMLHDQDPADNYIEAGSAVVAIYDGTNFQLISPDANP